MGSERDAREDCSRFIGVREQISEVGRETPPGIFQGLRHHAGLANRGHEVGVARPARNDVQVEMLRHSGASALSEVPADVQSTRAIDVAEHRLHVARQKDRLAQRTLRKAGQVLGVGIRHHHQVSAGIGVAVQNQVVFARSPKHEIRLVLVSRGGNPAKDTACFVAFSGHVL